MKIHSSFNSLSNLKNPIVTIGTFDGVHRGHLSILERLKERVKERGGESVLLTFYPHPRMVLHPDDHNIELLSTPEEKAQKLEEAGIQHLVVHPFSLEFSRLSPFDYVRDLLVTGLHADTVIIGYDHRFGRNREGNHQTLVELSETFGFRVEEIPPHMIDDMNVSSTKIRQALHKGEIEEAAKYLGYHYTLSGTVSRGDGIGRTFGYPTANVVCDYEFKLIPANGIYAVRVYLGERKLNGVLSIGVRPTINSLQIRSVEVYIFNFHEDIYGEKIKLEFVKYLRPELKFGTIDELKTNIAQDIENAKSFL